MKKLLNHFLTRAAITLLVALLSSVTGAWAEGLTVYNGTNTSSYIPVYGSYVDTQGATSEFIIPAETEGMSSIVGATITKLTFYISGNPSSWGSPTIQLYMGEVEGTTLSSVNGPTQFSVVATGVWSNQQTTVEVALDEPYIYEGGNLLIGTYVQTASSTYKLTYFFGVEAPSGSSRYSYEGPGKEGTAQSFLPKTTFTYTPGTGVVYKKPTNLTVSDLTSDRATISWTAPKGSPTRYDYQYKKAADENWSEVATTTTTSAPISGLTPSTVYNFRVKAVYGTDGESGFASTNFTTYCAPYDIPYTYDFEEAAPFDCWTAISGTVSRQSGTTNSGNYRLDFRGTTSNMIALPQFNAPTNTLRVEFYTRPESSTNSSCGNFAVGYMTNITDPESFVAVKTYAYNEWASATYEKKTVDFNGAPANACIAMRQNNCATNYYWYVDDVTVKTIPSCLAPTALTADNITTTSADLSWTSNASVWTVYYKKSSADTYTEVANVTKNPYTLEGLDPSSFYQFYVVANCSNTDSSEPSEVFTFMTDCGAIAALGYSENFDDFTVASGSSSRTLPLCWNYINKCTNSSYKYYPTIYYYGYTSFNYANSKPNSLRFYSYYSSYSNYDPQPQYAILPPMNGLAGKQVTLKARSSSNTSSTFKIGTMSDPTDAKTFTMIAEQGGLTESYPEEPFEYIIPANCSDSYLAIMIDAATSSRTSNGVYIDDIVIVNAPTCIKPTDLTVTATTTNTASLRWTNGAEGQTAWQICINGDETKLILANSNPFIVEGLTSGTPYTAKVRAYCSETDQSNWSKEVSFTTQCDAITTYPWTENFDSYTIASDYAPSAQTLPSCWGGINTTAYDYYKVYPTIYYYNNTANSTPNCLRLYSYASFNSDGSTTYDPQPQYAIFPQMGSLGGKYITLHAKGYNTSSTFKIGTMTNPLDASTFTPIATQTLTTSYEEYIYQIPTGTTANHVAIMIEAATADRTTNSVYIDDITIEASACPKPRNLSATPNAQTATISWECESSSFEVAHSTDANANPDNVITGTINAKSYLLENLDLGDHFVWVRTKCGETEHSAWVGPISFHIGYCQPAPSSVDGNGISNVTFGVGDNVVNNNTSKATYTDCTSKIGSAQAGMEATVAITYATGYSYGTIIWVDWNRSMTFEDNEIVYTGTSTNSKPTTLNATFVIPATQATGNYRMRIGGADSAFDSFIGGDASANHNPCYTGSYACFQDYTLRVLAAPSCVMPSGLTLTDCSNTSATLSWRENGTATAWQICLNGNETNLIDVTAAQCSIDNGQCSMVLTNLTPSTDYTVKVRSVNGGNTSIWTQPLSFRTTGTPTVVSNYWNDDFESDQGWDLLNGNLANKWVRGTAASNNGTYALYISNDGGVTNAYSNTNTKVLATKLLTFVAGKYEFNYDWKANGESSYDFLRVALVPCTISLTADEKYDEIGTANLPEGWIALDGGSKLNGSTTWQTKNAAVDIATGNYYLVAAWRNDYNNNNTPPAAIDNVSITKVACEYDVTGLGVSNISATGATLNWTAGEATQWQVAYSANSNFKDATQTIVNTAAYTISGLQPATHYYTKVRACNGTDYGVWSTVVQFTTDCAAPATPYTYGFETQGEFTCWTTIAGAAIANDNSIAHGGSNYLKFSGSTNNIVALPQFENATNTLRISLWTRPERNDASSCGRFSVGYLTDVTDANTFVALETYNYNDWTSNTYVQKTVDFNKVPENARIAFRHQPEETYYYWFVDDITVEDLPNANGNYALNGSNVLFFDDNLNMITEAKQGQKVTVDGDPDVLAGEFENYYFTGTYTSNVDITVNEQGEGTFIMPAKNVTVTADIAPQEEYTVDLSTVDIQEVPERLAGYLTALLGYTGQNEETKVIDRIDIDRDGTPDVRINNVYNEQTGQTACSVTKLQQLTANYRFKLNIPGYPYQYNSVCFKFTATDEVIDQPALEMLGDRFDNSATLAEMKADSKTHSVFIAERTLFKDNDWNTLCLPFAVALEGSPLADATLMELDVVGKYTDAGVLDNTNGTYQTSFDNDNGILYLYFKNASSIEAGKPYIIKWEKGKDIYEPLFRNIIVTSDTPTDVTFNGGKFVGIYDPWTVYKEDQSVLFLGSNNKLYYPKPTLTDPNREWSDDNPMNYPFIGAFRAYFKIDLGNANAVRAFVLTFGDEGTTGIENIQSSMYNVQSNDVWYSLDGRRLTSKPTKKGLYIHGGKKVVIP